MSANLHVDACRSVHWTRSARNCCCAWWKASSRPRCSGCRASRLGWRTNARPAGPAPPAVAAAAQPQAAARLADRVRLADRQRQAHRRASRARRRGRGPRGARLRRRRLSAQGPRPGAAARRGDEHARRRRSAGRRARLHRVPRLAPRAEARAADVLGAGARRFELSEVLRNRPPGRRTARRARRAAHCWRAWSCDLDYERARHALARAGRRPARATRSARNRRSPRSRACARCPSEPLYSREKPFAGRDRRQPAYHRPRRDQGRASRRDRAGGLGPQVRAGRRARRLAREPAAGRRGRAGGIEARTATQVVEVERPGEAVARMAGRAP